MPVVHPFPARMAPDIAKDAVKELSKGSRLLDPMCGSGTVLRCAVERDVEAQGIDIDPLAVMMARTWISNVEPEKLILDTHNLIERAKQLIQDDFDVNPSWHDKETSAFASFWFAEKQRRQLSALAVVLAKSRSRSREAIMVALSRTIVTKDRGVSLARDTSHSRPHRSWTSNDVDVFDALIRSVRTLAVRLNPHLVRSSGYVRRGDCRDLQHIATDSIDCVITSPPYLNAIDYLRGHRLSLIWLGFSVAEVRLLRGESVGSERGDHSSDVDLKRYVTSSLGMTLPERHVGWFKRYYQDAVRCTEELGRVVRSKGNVVIVVGNSFLKGCNIDNARVFEDLLGAAGFSKIVRREREIPARRRYLPPPSGTSPLAARMRSEVVLTGTHS
jgi:DNA modification methylase